MTATAAPRWTYPYVPTARQTLAHQTIVDELLYGGAAGGGKALAVDTLLPTPDGWTAMGNVQPGDQLLGADGRPTTVLAATGVMHDRPCYELTFDDGTKITADAEHLWSTLTVAERSARARRTDAFRASRRANRPSRGTGRRPDLATQFRDAGRPPPVPSPRTTQELAGSLRNGVRLNHTIALAAALDLPAVDLPLDPYALGLWLGDGTSANAGFTTADPELLDGFTRAGHSTKKWGGPYAYGVGDGFQTALRLAGLLRNKHIPPAYLRASGPQRLALLTGIVDTDGAVAADGRVEVTLTNPRLARDVHELALTLGVKATIRESDAMLNGRVVGLRWRITWTDTLRCATLRRKADRLPTGGLRGVQSHWFIVSVTPVDTVPVRCVQVEAADHLYLAGPGFTPTHNSEMLLASLVTLCLLAPGARTVFFRRTHPDLVRAVIPRLRERIPAAVATFNATDSEWRFRNGSVLELGYLQHDADVYKYQSAEYQLMAFDELTQFTPFQYIYLRSRLRAAGHLAARLAKLGWRPRVIAAANPGGVGHHWVKARFIDPSAPFQPFRVAPTLDDPKPAVRVFIPARTSDNPYLDASYEDRLASLGDPVLVRALLDGDWDILEGVRFTQWRRELHVIDPGQFPIPAGGGILRGVGVDYGVGAPFAALWGAKFHDGLVVVYRELYKAGLSAAEQAKLIADSEGPDERGEYQSVPIALDPASWARGSTTPGSWKSLDPSLPPPGSIAYAYRAQFGGAVVKAQNDRLGGWQLVDHHLKVQADGLPRLLVYSTCRNLIRTLPALPRSKQNPEDVDTRADDHSSDALRYLLQLLAGRTAAPAAGRNRDPNIDRGMPAQTANLSTAGF